MKSIIIYYSNSGTTRKLAEQVHEAFPGELIEVVPKVPYGGYLAAVRRAGKENRKGIIAEYTAPELDLSDVDTIFVGYPIWYSKAPSFLRDYLKRYDLTGKRVIPFSTAGANNIKVTLENFKEAVPGADLVLPYNYTKREKDDFDLWVKKVKGEA